MNEQIKNLQAEIEPLRQEILNHKVYKAINNIDDLKIFMEYHIFAVWDFMSILKALQNNLTCTSVPWYPVGDAETRHLINEIVAGEESDIDLEGNHKSHFELYLDAMKQCGANTEMIAQFIETLKETRDFQKAFNQSKTPEAARNFVNFTFGIINSKKDYLQSSIFTFGREDLIPGMFYSIVNDINSKFPESVSIFKYYLDRHIEVDGDHHSHLALQMTANLCKSEQHWQEATEAAKASLQQRIALWDGAYQKITEQKTKTQLEFA